VFEKRWHLGSLAELASRTWGHPQQHLLVLVSVTFMKCWGAQPLVEAQVRRWCVHGFSSTQLTQNTHLETTETTSRARYLQSFALITCAPAVPLNCTKAARASNPRMSPLSRLFGAAESITPESTWPARTWLAPAAAAAVNGPSGKLSAQL
jgi:hypothetical protein